MHITLLAISDSDKDFAHLVAEYLKRLGKQVSIHNIKPIKHGTPQQIIDKETDLLIKKIEKRNGDTICLMSKSGTQYPSEKFASFVSTGHVLFVIGGPYGIDESRILPYCDRSCSFGKQTMPHGLVKVVLLEQIWRAHCIITGRSYHY